MGDMTRATGVGRGATPCPADCTCAKHGKSRVVDWNDPEAVRAYKREKAAEKYAADPEPARESARRWRERNPGRRGRLRDTAAELKWMYGLTPERWREMFVAQGGCCYLCGEPLDTERKHGINIDHDHACCRSRRSCGSCVRGLACHGCNSGIGNFGDDPERLRRVADNLEMANRRLRSPAPYGADKAGSNAPAGMDE